MDYIVERSQHLSSTGCADMRKLETISIRRIMQGDLEKRVHVLAYITGALAVHTSLERDDRYVISHIDTGSKLPSYYSLKEDAITVAEALEPLFEGLQIPRHRPQLPRNEALEVKKYLNALNETLKGEVDGGKALDN